MAINNAIPNEFEALGNKPATEPAAAQPAPAAPAYTGPQTAQAQPQPQPQVRQPRGLLNTSNRNVPYNRSSGKIVELTEAFQTTALNYQMLQLNKDNWEMLIFDGSVHQTRISAILFIVKDRDNKVAVWPWLVEDSMETPIADRQVTIPTMGTVAIPQLAEQLMTSDPVVPTRIIEMVKARYPQHKVFLVGGMVLPSILEKTNTDQIARCIFYSNDAIETTFALLNGDNSARLTMLDRRQEETLNLRQEFLSTAKVSNACGLPVRSDISVKLSVNNSQNKQQSIGSLDEQTLSTARMFPVLMYDPDNNQPMQPMMLPNGQPYWGTHPCFQTYLVITSLDNQFAGATLESQLLTLSTVTSVIANDNWKTVFRPNMAIKGEGADPRDIGALTRDVNLTDRNNLGYTRIKDADANVNQFINDYIKPTIIFQLDVAELGELTYLQRAFIEAAGVVGPEKQARARASIIDAANYLTNGKFSNYFNPSEDIVIPQVGRIEKGYWVNEQGELASIEEIDYLHLLNRVSETSVAREFMDTFNPLTGDEIVRFARRRAIYDTYFSGRNLTITGYAQRLTLNSNFLSALALALSDNGGRMDITTSFNQAEIVRGFHNQVLGLGAQSVASFYSMGGYNPNPTGNYQWYSYQPGSYASYGNGPR